MIKVEFGNVESRGCNKELYADLSSISSYVFEYLRKTNLDKKKAKEKILLSVERGFLINEKLDTGTIDKMNELTEAINRK